MLVPIPQRITRSWRSRLPWATVPATTLAYIQYTAIGSLLIYYNFITDTGNSNTFLEDGTKHVRTITIIPTGEILSPTYCLDYFSCAECTYMILRFCTRCLPNTRPWISTKLYLHPTSAIPYDKLEKICKLTAYITYVVL
ncbi:hypothetical protein EDD16DRAFT_1638055, partial [Pisolithus croceorrhizus]